MQGHAIVRDIAVRDLRPHRQYMVSQGIAGTARIARGGRSQRTTAKLSSKEKPFLQLFQYTANDATTTTV